MVIIMVASAVEDEAWIIIKTLVVEDEEWIEDEDGYVLANVLMQHKEHK